MIRSPFTAIASARGSLVTGVNVCVGEDGVCAGHAGMQCRKQKMARASARFMAGFALPVR